MERSAVELSQGEGVSPKVDGNDGIGTKLWINTEVKEPVNKWPNEAAELIIITLASIITSTAVLSPSKLAKSTTAADDETCWALFIVFMIFMILLCFIPGILNLVPSEKEEEAHGNMVVKNLVLWVSLPLAAVTLLLLLHGSL